MAAIAADRNLLFGLLALQNGLINQGQLVAAFQAWSLDKRRALADHLGARGDLDADDRAAVEALVARHLKKHGGDVERSLAAIPAGRSTRASLARIDDPDIGGTLAHLGSASTPHGEDADRTASYALGEATSEGQRFRVLRPHAKGGLGAVFVALDQELHREVALKQILDRHADDPTSRARFLLEAEITGRLEHPGVVPVYGLGCDAEGRPFYAMRLVMGDTLKEAIDRLHAREGDAGGDPRRWNPELRQLLNRFVAVCNVVAYAHSRGVIHRDLKPANILLGPYGETLVVDWGLAKVVGRGESAATAGAVELTLQPASSSGSGETLPGTALGTPAYMSPEQAEGRLEQVGPPSDLYSLGATLYCLLTGKPPLEGDVGEVLRRAQRGEFPPPRKVNPQVPPALEPVCLKAMATNPDDRYDSPHALAGDVEHWLADEPVSAYRDPPAVRLTRWGRRHRTAAVGIGALLVTAVVALGLSTVLIGREQAQTDRARRELERQLYVDRVNRAYTEWEVNNIALTERLLEECPPGRRGWEWSFVRRLGHLDERTDRDAEQVQALAISPDGRTVASGGGAWPDDPEAKGELVLRDAATGQERFAPLRGLPTIIVGLAFSPGSDRIVSAGVRKGAEHKGELTLWDARTGRVLTTQRARDLAVLGVAISRDGRYVAASYGVEKDDEGGAGHVKVWEVSTDTLKPIATLTDPDHAGPVPGVAFHPDGRIAAAGVGRVRIWDVKGAGWSPGRVLPGHTGIIFAVAFRPDGKQIATAGWDRTIRLWDPDSGREVRALYGHTGFVRCLAYDSEGRRLATGSEDRSVLVWDTATGRPEAAFRGHQAFVMALAFYPDGRRLASGGTDRLVKTWDLAGGQPLAFRGHGGWVQSLDFSPDGARVVSGGGLVGRDWSVRVWDASTGRDIRSYAEHRAPVVGVRFRPDGRHVVSFGLDDMVRVWDVTTGRDVAPPVVVSPPPPAAHTSGTIRPDGRELAIGATDGTVRLWDLSTGRVSQTLSGHTGTVFGLAYDRDGLRLASTSALGPSHNDSRPGGELKLWDVATGRELAAPRRGIGAFQWLAFSPDGHRLALSGGFLGAGETQVWDAATGQTLLTLRGHATKVQQVAFSPDGTRIATASDDRTVKLWDAVTGQEVFTLRGHTAGIIRLAFSPDGHRLASGGIDWTARVWDARPPDDGPRSPPD